MQSNSTLTKDSRYYFRKIHADPSDVESMRRFINACLREGMELPNTDSKIEEGLHFYSHSLSQFTKEAKEIIGNIKNKLDLDDDRVVESYVKSMQTGDPSYLAFCATITYVISRRCAEEIIENDKVGNPSEAAIKMCALCGSKSKWAAKIIDKNDKGELAYKLSCASDIGIEWTMRHLEERKDDSLWYVSLFCDQASDGTIKWAKNLIEASKVKDRGAAAYKLFSNKYPRSLELQRWAEKIVVDSKDLEIARLMVEFYGSSPEWLAENFDQSSTQTP